MESLILHAIQILLLFVAALVIVWMVRGLRQPDAQVGSPKKLLLGGVMGFVVDMLDTWGIGSFATTTVLFKATHFMDDDRKLPGTMNVAHVLPVIVEALFFITAVKVEVTTLIPMTTAAVIGAYVGSRLSVSWNTQMVRLVLGVLLLVAAAIMIFRLLTNPGADASAHVRGLSLPWLLAGVCYNFVLGILMTMGLGNYAPELVFFSLAGVNPLIALPVMMLDAAMIMTTGSFNFIRQKRVVWPGLVGIATGGILGVFFAARIVTTLNLEIFKIATIVIIVYTGGLLIYESLHRRATPRH